MSRHSAFRLPLSDYYFSDSRVALVPIEHLNPAGVSGAFAAVLRERAGWRADQVDLLDAAFALYWTRTAALAARTPTWAPPRLRHIAVVGAALAVHPYAQLLNTSAWTLYAADLDPVVSHPEFAAYLLAHGDRMAMTGEVTMAGLHHAAWWFERTDDECAAFASAAQRSQRPDADAYRTLADALPWLRVLRHEVLRPAPTGGHRAVPGTGLLVPDVVAAEPPALVERWMAAARAAVADYEASWRGADAEALHGVLDWLAGRAPPLLVLSRRRVLWDPQYPGRCGALRSTLKHACGAAVRDLHRDLEVAAEHTRRFLAALAQPDALPGVAAATEQRGYVFLHHQRRLLAYDLDEPGIDRRGGPALPYARAMLGARAVHEWAHLAVDAGWVPCRDDGALRRHNHALAALLDAAISAAPAHVAAETAADLATLTGSERAASPGAALAGLLARRLSDFQANLLAQRFLADAERETYVRQNIRTLRPDYPTTARWRMLARYLYEYQYLRFSAVADRRTFFLRSTWFDTDFFASGALTEACFDELAAAVAAICDCYAVDESRFRSSTLDPGCPT